MPSDPTWDFQNPASKDRLLRVLERETAAFFELTADPSRWHAPTACAGWEVRDMVGHLVDATESFLSGFEVARHGVAGEEPVGIEGMAAASDQAARALRTVPRVTLLERLHEDNDRLMHEFQSLTDDEWSELIVPDRYMGPLPAMLMVAGSLAGIAVHCWDIRQGLGKPHAIAGDAADLVAPLVFLLWSVTADTASVADPYAIGIRTTGHNGGDTRFDVAKEGLRFATSSIDDCQAVLEFDPGTLVLTGYGRISGGTVRGDRLLASSFLALFVSI